MATEAEEQTNEPEGAKPLWVKIAPSAMALASLIIALASAGFSYYQLREMQRVRMMPVATALFEKRLEGYLEFAAISQTLIADDRASTHDLRMMMACRAGEQGADCFPQGVLSESISENLAAMGTRIDKAAEICDRLAELWPTTTEGSSAIRASGAYFKRNSCLHRSFRNIRMGGDDISCLTEGEGEVQKAADATRELLAKSLGLDRYDLPR